MGLNIDIGRLLNQGLQAKAEGRLEAAWSALAEVLKHDADEPHALQLLGEMAQARGDRTGAETLLERALRAHPELPYAWSRLGSIKEGLGDARAAEGCYRRATELKHDFAAAHYNRARLLRDLADPAGAASCLDQALRCQIDSPTLQAQMLQLQALLQEDAGQLEPALATLDQALQATPQRAALHHNRGVLLHRLARPTEALAAHGQALRLGLDAADAHYNRGNSLQSLGRSIEALEAYRTALSRDPQHALALYDTARLRWRLGDADFTAELDAAAIAAPGSAVPPGIKGRLLLRAGRHQEAAAAYAQAAALADTHAGYIDGLAQALARLGRWDEALAAHDRAVQLAPQLAAAHISHASSLLQCGQVTLAAQVAERAVRLDPLDQQAWAVLGLAWRAGGDRRESWLNDHQQQVQVYDLLPPEDWDDMASFNQALAAALEPQHTDAAAPIDQTLRHGSQTLGNLFEQGHPLVMQLKVRIAEAVDRYIAHLESMPRDDAHPLRSRTSQRWRFTDSWSSRLHSSGFHTNHVHPHGWISSCYYVAVPRVVLDGSDAAPTQAGWIHFGAPDLRVPGQELNARRAERPRAGRLVLFPSFLWHGTVPFTGDQPRLTVAFDVMPVA